MQRVPAGYLTEPASWWLQPPTATNVRWVLTTVLIFRPWLFDSWHLKNLSIHHRGLQSIQVFCYSLFHLQIICVGPAIITHSLVVHRFIIFISNGLGPKCGTSHPTAESCEHLWRASPLQSFFKLLIHNIMTVCQKKCRDIVTWCKKWLGKCWAPNFPSIIPRT